MNSSGFTNCQDTLQADRKLYIVVNIDIDQYGKQIL